MSISLLSQFFFVTLLSAIICTKNITHAYKQCMNDEKTLLLDLRNDLKFISSDSKKLTSWNQTDNCCRWDGVECDGAGHVISLQLNNEGIYGGIDSSSSLFSLRYLKKLNLAQNDFNGSEIPRGISNLTYLTHLDLSYSNFGGKILMELSLLTRLVSLDLSFDDNFGPLNYDLKLAMLLKNLTGLQELYLDNIDISGEKSEWYNIISSSLPNLRNLSLRHCSLSSPSDPSLLQFHSLTKLRLDGNNLSSVAPNFFANFSSLNVLSLNNCSLKGSLDFSNNLLLHSLSNLVYLNLGANSLSGSIPQSLFTIPSLHTLILSSNKFSGQVNEFPALNFSNMEELDLSDNQLEGPVPNSFFLLQNLRVLYLHLNSFNGTLQLAKIQKLRNLSQLVLSHNNLSVDTSNTNSSLSTFPQLYRLMLASCNLYYFPDFIKQSQTLQYLDLSNNRIAGEIPSWIWEIGNGTLSYLNISCNLLVDLQKPYKIPDSLWCLDLHSNKLRGELPLPPRQATYVDYSDNNFDEPIPPNFGDFLPYVALLSLKNNNLSGSIPPSLCTPVYLQVLDLSANKLSGNIPSCLLENMKYLEVLSLSRNNINGEIPDKFSVNCSLNSLYLSHNYLSGNIPSSLGNCKSLKVLNVGYNYINDTFPCMLSSSLLILVLRSNRFYGEVRCHKTWPNLQIIDIASNSFSGNLNLLSFSSWRGMVADSNEQLRQSGSYFDFLKSSFLYQDEVTLTIKGLELKLVKIWPDFTSIDFSRNNFKGEIPDAIGDLTSLYLLNLSHNALTGTIPRSLGKLRKLGSLDLSENELTGAVPMELARLTFLSVLNLSFNKLVGEIPIGSQLQTFSADSFEGNRGLCGKPINISCTNIEHGSVEMEEKTMEIEWEYVSAAVGYVVGLGSFVWVLFGCISFREIYFHKIDEILEKIFTRHKRRRRQGRRSVGRNQVRRR